MLFSPLEFSRCQPPGPACIGRGPRRGPRETRVAASGPETERQGRRTETRPARRRENPMIPNDIDQQAPVISRHSAVIEAPIEVLWGLHTDVDAWPSWQPDIETARLDGSFDRGSTFSWHTSGLDIDSTVYRVEPGRYTLWGAPAHGIVGVHSWTFTPVECATRVDTAESWSGEP